MIKPTSSVNSNAFTRPEERSPDEPRGEAENLMLIMEGAVARAPVIGGAAAARCGRRLAARLLADSPSRADNTRRDL